MNILCIDQFATWGGGQRSLLDLLPSFRKQGWRPHIVLPGEGRFSEELDRSGYPTTILRSGSYTSIQKPLSEICRYAWETPRLTGKLLRISDDLGADLFYVNGPRVLPQAAWVARQRGIPLVFHCHHLLGQWSAIQMTRLRCGMRMLL